MEVLLIALGHAVPVLLVGLLKRDDSRWLNVVAIIMAVVAISWGSPLFRVTDVFAVVIAWLVARQAWQTKP